MVLQPFLANGWQFQNTLKGKDEKGVKRESAHSEVTREGKENGSKEAIKTGSNLGGTEEKEGSKKKKKRVVSTRVKIGHGLRGK